MTPQQRDGHCWAAARAAARALERRPEDRRLLALLTRAPLLSPRAAAGLTGQAGLQGVHRRLARLRAEGLVGMVRPSFRAQGAPRLPYLIDLGLATVALTEELDATDMVERLGLGRDALLRRLPGLEHLLNAYALLGQVARARPGDPRVVAWERPWRHRFVSSTAKHPVTVLLPAYAELSWDGHRPAGFFLVPDPGTVPLRVYRPTLVRLLQLRHRWPRGFPLLVVLVWEDDRAAAWRDLLVAAARERGDAPLAACVGRWRALTRALRASVPVAEPVPWSFASRPPTRAPRPHACQPGRALPAFVGPPLDAPTTEPASDAERQGHLALGLTARDGLVLGLIGRHPFLPLDGLAALLGVGWSAARWLRRALVERGLVRLVTRDEVHALLARGRNEPPTAETVERIAARELAELTADGFALAAAAEGLRPRAAIRYRGLGGGGPDQPLGTRRHLAKDLDHTLGVYDVFIRLVRLAVRRAGAGDEMLAWDNARTSTRGGCRPDGYGVYRHGGTRHGFLLEFDRCRMYRRDLEQKLNAYHTFFENELRQSAPTYPEFPTILFVVAHGSRRRMERAEARIAAIARKVAAARGRRLPILISRLDLVEQDPDGPLGRVWRSVYGPDRCGWPGTPCGSTAAVDAGRYGRADRRCMPGTPEHAKE